MKYAFQPASNIQDYLDAIKGNDEFIIKRDVVNGIIVINYMYVGATTFPDPMLFTGDEHRRMVLRRDCRGIKFDINTGDVVTKTYAKFFNVNQLPETQSHAIDWTRPHVILEKLDGSMVTAYKHSEGWQWHTKMGATDVAKPIYDAVGDAYTPFCEAMREEGLSALFEWCSRKQRIVIDYPADQLVLTGIRHNVSGQYLSYPEMMRIADRFKIPVVRALPGSAENIQRFMDETAAMEDIEGFVIRFDDGHMVKSKGLWYCQIHSTKDALSLEKNVWQLVLNNALDDLKPFMDAKDRTTIESFSDEFDHRIRLKAATIAAKVDHARFAHDKKRFAVELAPLLPKEERSLAFRIWDGHDPVLVLRNYLAGNVQTQTRLDGVRHLVDGLSWQDFHYITTD